MCRVINILVYVNGNKKNIFFTTYFEGNCAYFYKEIINFWRKMRSLCAYKTDEVSFCMQF